MNQSIKNMRLDWPKMGHFLHQTKKKSIIIV